MIYFFFLFQGRPGDETATAFCVPVLERVLERYPASLPLPLPPKEGGSAEMSASAPASDAATPPPPEPQAYELVALVLTRTREMAADIAVSPLLLLFACTFSLSYKAPLFFSFFLPCCRGKPPPLFSSNLPRISA